MRNQGWLIFLGGVAIGVGATLAVNSKEGKKVRKKIAKEMRREKERLMDAVDTIRDKAEDAVDTIRAKAANVRRSVCDTAGEILEEEGTTVRKARKA